jgi:hypothetical protein
MEAMCGVSTSEKLTPNSTFTNIPGVGQREVAFVCRQFHRAMVPDMETEPGNCEYEEGSIKQRILHRFKPH